MSADQIWAEEGGIMVRFERVGGRVSIEIRDVSGREDKVLASATLGGWRWDRAVKAMELTGHATGERG